MFILEQQTLLEQLLVQVRRQQVLLLQQMTVSKLLQQNMQTELTDLIGGASQLDTLRE